jgi:hypothetical protein
VGVSLVATEKRPRTKGDDEEDRDMTLNRYLRTLDRDRQRRALARMPRVFEVDPTVVSPGAEVMSGVSAWMARCGCGVAGPGHGFKSSRNTI